MEVHHVCDRPRGDGTLSQATLSFSAPMLPLLLSVQAMEFAWVILNYLGVQKSTHLNRRQRSSGEIGQVKVGFRALRSFTPNVG
jgi:hypothetical protein